jgi:hypothetical protein
MPLLFVGHPLILADSCMTVLARYNYIGYRISINRKFRAYFTD